MFKIETLFITLYIILILLSSFLGGIYTGKAIKGTIKETQIIYQGYPVKQKCPEINRG